MLLECCLFWVSTYIAKFAHYQSQHIEINFVPLLPFFQVCTSLIVKLFCFLEVCTTSLLCVSLEDCASWLSSILGNITKTRHFKYTEILPPKNENFQIKNSDIFHISAQNIDCGYSFEPPWWGGSYEYPQSMFLNRNKKNNVYPCKPQFYYIKVGCKGFKII